jgi:hypothetical protein
MAKIDWKRRALVAEACAARYMAYAQDYGNATGICKAGYLQQNGLICHHCQHDNSDGSPCPRAKSKTEKGVSK